MNPRTRNILLIIAVLLISASLVMDVYAQDAFVVKDGHDVIQNIQGKIYVGTGVAFQGPWVTLFNIEFPKNKDGSSIGAVTFPAEQVSMVYHQGQMGKKLPYDTNKWNLE